MAKYEFYCAMCNSIVEAECNQLETRIDDCDCEGKYFSQVEIKTRNKKNKDKAPKMRDRDGY